MKSKVFKFLFISLLIAGISSCSDSKENDGPDSPGNDKEEETIINLSAEAQANCYIVQVAGKYKFLADNQFNLGEGLPVPPEINPESAKLLWQTEKGSVIDVELVADDNGKYIEFEVVNASGNALIGALDSEGSVVWSWHIWMPQSEITSVHSDTGYDIMNMNLGALNDNAGDALSYGMLYQWGRKDPFPAAATLTGDTQTIGAPLYDEEGNTVVIKNSSWTNDTDNTLEYSIANPTVCLSNYSHYATTRDWLKEGDDSLWGNPEGYATQDWNYLNRGRKTCYDPSPAGWRVAPADAFRNFTTTMQFAWNLNEFCVKDINEDGIVDLADYEYGWHFYINEKETLYFPAASRYDGSYAMLMGSMSGLWGNYWSNSPSATMAGGAFCGLSFQVKDQNGGDFLSVAPAGQSSKADAFSIRCVRDF